MVVIDIVLIEEVVIAKVIEDQILHYVKYLTGSIDSIGSNSRKCSRGHSLIRRRTHNESNRGSGTSLCEVPD